MSLDQAFDDHQTEVNVKDRNDKKARERRDVFKAAFDPNKRPDVDRTFASGSLARGSQIDPIHDVDMVTIFDAGQHPDWGQPGDSAAGALEEIRGRVHELLHHENGTVARAVRRVDIKNHSLKCFLDDPDITNAFTVDLVPALAYRGHLLIPEKESRTWVKSDPEHLIDLVAGRHARWSRFVPLVRVLKRWNTDHGGHMKSLVVEVLALHHLPDADRRSTALQRFFAAAAARIHEPVTDPADLCGVIQPDLDVSAAYDELDEAASWAYKAVLAEERGETDEAECCWRKLFGDIFPEPLGGCPADPGTGTGLIIPTSVTVPAVTPPPRKIIDAPQG